MSSSIWIRSHQVIASNQLSKATEPFWCTFSFSSCRVFENQGMNSIVFTVHSIPRCVFFISTLRCFPISNSSDVGDKVFWQSCSKLFVGEPAGQKWVDLCSKLKKFWHNLQSNTKNQTQPMLKVPALEMFLWLNWVTYFHYITPVLLQEVLVAKLTVFVDFWIRGFKHLPNMWYLILLLPTVVFFNYVQAGIQFRPVSKIHWNLFSSSFEVITTVVSIPSRFKLQWPWDRPMAYRSLKIVFF